MDDFWVHNTNVLLQKDRLTEFWPAANMSSNEALNSITRFVLYSSIVLSVYRKDIFVLLAGMVIVIMIGYIGMKDSTKKVAVTTKKTPKRTPEQSARRKSGTAINEYDQFDVHNAKFSEHQFSSHAQEVEHDQSAFAHWLYAPRTERCKENPNNCTGFYG